MIHRSCTVCAFLFLTKSTGFDISLLFTCVCYYSVMCGAGDQYFVGFVALLIKFVDASFEDRT